MKTAVTRERMITFLLQAPLFENLDPDEIQQVLHIVEVRSFQAGDTVFKEGEPGDTWYVLYRGEVEVLTNAKGEAEAEVISILSPPACFGEMAVLDGLPRWASIRASEDSIVLCVSRTAFDELLASGDEVATKLLHQIAILLAHRARLATTKLMKLLQACEVPSVHASIRQMIGEATIRE